jgi:hypothetical protein
MTDRFRQPTHAYVALLNDVRVRRNRRAFALEHHLVSLQLDSVFTFLPMSLFAMSGLSYQNDSNATGPRNSLGALRHSNLPSWILANGERGSYIFLKRSVHSLAVLFPDTRSHTDSCSAQQVHELVDEWNLESLGALLAPI